MDSKTGEQYQIPVSDPDGGLCTVEDLTQSSKADSAHDIYGEGVT
jgi:hypothetical protein